MCIRDSISFADVSLVRDAIACHRNQVLADLGAKPTETAWYWLSTAVVRPGLRLSHSSTLGSTACVLSCVLSWFSGNFEAACLVFLEDHLRAAQLLSTSGCFGVQGSHAEKSCPLGTDPKYSGGACSALGNSEQRGGAKVPRAPLDVPTPDRELLGRYGLMCGENQRVPILEAVPNVLCELLLHYYKQLPLAVWQRICLQSMQAMQRSASIFSPAYPCCDVSQHEHGEWPDECPWAYVQELAGEMLKLLISTFHDVYCQSSDNQGLQLHQGCPEHLMSYERVLERLKDTTGSSVMCGSMMLTDAPATYRRMVANDHHLLIRTPMVRPCMLS